jgi:pilus assembly protein Flp/PilA
LLVSPCCSIPREISMYNLVRKFMADESGATSIEYGLIAAGIGVALITLVGQVGGELRSLFENLQTGLQNFNASTGTPQ